MTYAPKPGEVFYFAVPMTARHADITEALGHVERTFGVTGDPVLRGTYAMDTPAYRLYSIEAAS